MSFDSFDSSSSTQRSIILPPQRYTHARTHARTQETFRNPDCKVRLIKEASNSYVEEEKINSACYSNTKECTCTDGTHSHL